MLARALLVIGVLATILTGGVQSIGVCNGMIGNDLPSPQDVVQLYRSKGISNMRIYAPHSDVMEALRGSGIGLVLGVDNGDILGLAASQASAASWVQTNVSPFYPGVNITYISVGNEVQQDGVVATSILSAMQNLEAALAAAGISGHIKVSTCVRLDVITNSFPPSMATFAKPNYMPNIVLHLATTGAPLLVNVYPYFAYRDNQKDISLNYATFQPGTTVRDDGNGLVYTNLFDAMVDAIHAALEKAKAPSVRVVVSESGWPSAGGTAASVQNAQAYNQGVINHVGKGTPKKPDEPLEAYLFAMFNENQKPGELTERNFGFFYPSQSPVYPITFK
ncbi:hypothetical protein PR202_ga08341 [Eleusine coracana subsp. coracana]|uniref:Uncharacterized protein n=1 Tax=Eleusine coracana subsp. coracana TaxID=191504 RepID=A0AAV5BZR5_ELECO|nr:hypothetical protein QOZ80_1AG0046220 [Eleusine coracana subsp. coracana]GJM91919.1 hypothetical protein PR202_ga08341 [Eleusine coracana subsp. coracana]